MGELSITYSLSTGGKQLVFTGKSTAEAVEDIDVAVGRRTTAATSVTVKVAPTGTDVLVLVVSAAVAGGAPVPPEVTVTVGSITTKLQSPLVLTNKEVLATLLASGADVQIGNDSTVDVTARVFALRTKD